MNVARTMKIQEARRREPSADSAHGDKPERASTFRLIRRMSTDEISNRRCRWLLNQRRFGYWREAEIGEILALHDKRPDFLVETPVPIRFRWSSSPSSRTPHSIRSIR